MRITEMDCNVLMRPGRLDRCGVSQAPEVARFRPKEYRRLGCGHLTHGRTGPDSTTALPYPAKPDLARRLHGCAAALLPARGWLASRIHRGSSGTRIETARYALRMEAGIGLPRASFSRRPNRSLPRPDRSAEPPETEHSFQRPLAPKRLFFAIPEIERHCESRG